MRNNQLMYQKRLKVNSFFELQPFIINYSINVLQFCTLIFIVRRKLLQNFLPLCVLCVLNVVIWSQALISPQI